MKKNHTPGIKMNRILVLRLSSMGDVLLALPVLKGILGNNPEVELVFVTRKNFVPYFTGIDRLIIVPFDPDGLHKGLSGLWRLFIGIRHYSCKRVVDLHGVLRTNLLDFLLLLNGCRIYKICKHRKIRRKILNNKTIGIKVPRTVDRYLRVFEKAGLAGNIVDNAFPPMDYPTWISNINPHVRRIGIAPVSKHRTKNWGLKNVSELISLLKLKYPVEIHLFGGTEDKQDLNSLSGPDIFNHAGMIDPLDEISLIQTMDLFVSMDSANMHLASLAGISTVSIWGATDPSLGFAPLNQPADYSLFADPADVTCRPCSVYGEIPCRRADAPMICMNSIKPGNVLDKINEILLLSDKN